MHKFKHYFFILLSLFTILALITPQAQALTFSNKNLFNFPKLVKKPKPSKTPKLSPTPSLSPSPSPAISPSPSQSVLTGAGFEISPARIDLTISLNETKKAFDLKSVTAGGFQMYGYPTDYGPGINWTVSSGGMTPGSTTDVGIQVHSSVEPGIYIGIGVVENLETGEKLNFPVKVKVVRPIGFPYVKIKFPNGGEEFTAGDTINIQWEGDKLNDGCFLGYTVGSGTQEWINTSIPGSARSFDWVAKEWYQWGEPDKMKITLDCYTDQGRVDDTSDDFFIVKPVATPPPSQIPVSSPAPTQYSPPFNGGVSIGVTIQSFFKKL